MSKSFLRWAGGKSWLNKYISTISTQSFNQYHEPFLGGGSIFFSLGYDKRAFLSDLNNDLIETYKALKQDVDQVISILENFENSPIFYYKIRDLKFTNSFESAARFIYLNQTSFNGIYRVNLKGVYNVPYGYRSKPFLDAPLLRNVSNALQNAELLTSDFEIVRSNIGSGDLVFLDPPYTVSHNLNGFIKYNEKLFSLEDQFRLSQLITYIKEVGAFYILTNAAHEKIKEIFYKGDYIYEVSRQSLIGGSKAFRGLTTEYMFSNIKI